jgi:ribosomal protein L16 Arg81 hydroxylase
VAVAVIQEWLGAVPLRQFLDGAYLQRPFVHASAALEFTPLGGWEVFGRIVAATPPPDTLVVRDGRVLSVAPPRSRSQLEALLATGASLVVRKAERHDPGLASLAAAFAAELQGPATIQLFATPAGHHSFGWHYDAEEVFILQTVGEKEYFFRQNTVNPRPLVETLPRDMAYERETSPCFASTLAAGDWLYLPAGFWHRAHAHQAALSISIGVLPPTLLDALDELLDARPEGLRERLRADPRWHQRLPLASDRRQALLTRRGRELKALLAQTGP